MTTEQIKRIIEIADEMAYRARDCHWSEDYYYEQILKKFYEI